MPRQKQPGQGSSCAEHFGKRASLCVYTRRPSSLKDRTMLTKNINGAHLVGLIQISKSFKTLMSVHTSLGLLSS